MRKSSSEVYFEIKEQINFEKIDNFPIKYKNSKPKGFLLESFNDKK